MGLFDFIGNYLSGYKESPEYVSAINNYNTLTNTNPDFYKTVTDLANMKQIDDAQSAMYEARADYRNNLIFGDKLPVLSNTIDNMDLQRLNLFNNPSPVGSINGNTIYSSYGCPEGRWRINDSGTGLQYHEPDDDSFGGLGGVLSFATGGLSDIVQGDPAFSGAISGVGDKIGLDQRTTDWITGAVSQFNPITGGVVGQLQEGYKAGSGDGSFDWGHAIDRAVDPAGTIDYSVRAQGELQNEIAPELTPYYKAAGPIIGGIVGSYVPVIGTAVGSAVGSGIGSKMTGGLHDFNYGSDLVDAGIAYVAADATQGIAPGVSELAGGGVVGGIAGGAAQGAVKGGLTGVKPALQTGNWDPVLYGAGLGGVVGGITGGINAYGADEAATQAAADKFYIDRYLQQNPSPYYDTITQQMINPGALSYDELLSNAYQAANPGFTPFTVDPLLQYATPADTALQGTLENSNALGTTNPEALSDKFYTDRYLQQNPSPYYDTITQQMITPPALTPDEILVQDYMKANPTPDVNTLSPPSTSYASMLGRGVLDNKDELLKLAAVLSGGGTAVGATAFPGGGGRPGMASPDAVTEFLMQHGGTGKGKSKGLKAGAAEGPYYGDSFMPGLREINKYDEQGLYYT